MDAKVVAGTLLTVTVIVCPASGSPAMKPVSRVVPSVTVKLAGSNKVGGRFGSVTGEGSFKSGATRVTPFGTGTTPLRVTRST
ncbi:MAG TPA: hypothetical protein PLD20_25985, partial [Blastocatellia bacterium]|nr:hypothetical protein [Blastocatellia bacterium]